MSNRNTVLVLVVAVAAAGAFALLRQPAAPAEPIADSPPPRPRAHPETSADPRAQGLPPGHPSTGLPAGHPPVGSGAAARLRPPSEEPASLTWKAPEAWQSVPNPNNMRLATYRIPRAGGDGEDAELSISRAGGSTEANLDRWVGQFDDAGKDERSTKTVQGLKVTVVSVAGTYLGASMMGNAATKKPGWSLLGAIVEAQGSSYFFKMVGPTATVKKARPDFERMIDGLSVK